MGAQARRRRRLLRLRAGQRAARRWRPHPAYSDAWATFDLPAPPTGGGWVRGICGGWSCYVEQARYGHDAKKATWLYAYGVAPPPLRWGHVPDAEVLLGIARSAGREVTP